MIAKLGSKLEKAKRRRKEKVERTKKSRTLSNFKATQKQT